MKCFIVVVLLCLAVVTCNAKPQRYRDDGFRSARQEAGAVADYDDGLSVIPLIPKSEVLPKAPYPPSGWKPTGERLRLPLPRIEYAAKSRVQYVPARVYGPPMTAVEREEATTMTVEDNVTTESGEQSTSTEAVTESVTTAAESVTTAAESVTTAAESVTAAAENVTTAAENVSTTEMTTPPSTLETFDRLRKPKPSLVETFPVSLGQLNQQGIYYVLLPDARLQRVFYSVAANPQRRQFSSRLQSIETQGLGGPLILYTAQ